MLTPAAGDAKSPSSVLGTRLAALSTTSTEALVQRRALYAELIAQHGVTISTLEADISAIGARIAAKTTEATNLLNRAHSLNREIGEKQTKTKVAGVLGGIFALATAGASAALGAYVAGGSLLLLDGLKSELRTNEEQRRRIAKELASLQAESAKFRGLQVTFGTQLGALRTAMAALDQAAPTTGSSLEALQAGMAHDRSVVANLEAQIAVLRAQRATAKGFEAVLDRMISGLQAQVGALEAQLEAANRALLLALVDVGVTAFGATGALRTTGLSAARRNAAIAGLAITGDMKSLVPALVGNLVRDGVVKAGGSAVLAATLSSVLSSQLRTPPETMQQLLQTAGLTAVQQGLLSTLAQEDRFDVEPLARAIIASPDIGAAQADVVRTMLAKA
jgi:predicted  nucleic acid-binding Zn-ribbon protein